MRPRERSNGENSTTTTSPGLTRSAFEAAQWAVAWRLLPASPRVSTLNREDGNASRTRAVISMRSLFAMLRTPYA